MALEFGDLLRRLRLAARLSQEALAERAGISTVAISSYERGIRTIPRYETTDLLVEALQLSGEARAEFEEAALRKRGARFSGEARPNNLPWQTTSFVGRTREIAEISRLIAPRRIVTVTGAGGIGKTRTSLEVAARLEAAPRDGVWFVDLAPIADDGLIVNKIASVLEIHLPERADPLVALLAAINTSAFLLVLDNCEHVIGAVRAIVLSVLDACPQIAFLATSRERLDIASEQTYRLQSLSLPTGKPIPASEIRSYDALELFAERAASAKHGLQFSDSDMGAAADICRRLGGIALAIELAAARLPVLGFAELQRQLGVLFQAAGGRHDLPARQRTLHATIAWSHALLGESERVLFRRLAIFHNGWTVEAAEFACTDALLERAPVLEALYSLAEKSLVSVDLDAATPRYSFFESTRTFALEQLAAAAEGAALSRRHAEWMAVFADRAYGLDLPKRNWELAVAPELDNALAALEWALGAEGDAVLGGRIAGALRGFWLSAELAAYGRRYITAALERIDAGEHPQLVARLLVAQFKFLQSTPSAGVASMKRAISMLGDSADPQTLARSYGFLSHALGHMGQYADSDRASDTSLAILRGERLERSAIYSGLLVTRGIMLRLQGRLDEAESVLSEALSLAIDVEDDWCISLCQPALADVAFATGDVRRAVTLGLEALANARRVRGANQEIYALVNLACYQLALGDIDAARSVALEAFNVARNSSADLAMHVAVQHLATAAALRGQASRAAGLLGYVNAWYDRVGSKRDTTDQVGYDILIGALHEQLSDEEIDALSAEGAQFTLEIAVREVLSVADARPDNVGTFPNN